MNISEILSLPEAEWLNELQIDTVVRNIQSNIDYYNGVHPILTDPSRADYFIDKWEVDEDGSIKTNPVTGKQIKAASVQIKRTRLVLNYQQQIIDTAVGMCVGSPVTLTLNSADIAGHRDAFNILVEQWRNKTRLDTFTKTMARALFKESKCAEVFFIRPDDEDKDIKVKLLCKENGDDIWGHFDDDGGLDAITRVFTKRVILDGKAEDVEVTQIWTAANRYEKIGDGVFEIFKNPYNKIQIVFYDQKKSEFEIVKELINKQEIVRSQNSDVNKRIGNPNVVISGKLSGMPDVDQDVKVWNAEAVETSDGGTVQSSVSYLQLTTAPESIKNELQDYKQDMYKLTWPDLSFLRDAIKTGTLSGTAIKLMFTDAFVKIGNKKEIFEDFSRRIAVMKRMLAISQGKQVFEELNISVQFNSILPENIAEITDYLSLAVQGEITSKENAVGQWPGNDNNPNVMDQIKTEQGELLGGVG